MKTEISECYKTFSKHRQIPSKFQGKVIFHLESYTQVWKQKKGGFRNLWNQKTHLINFIMKLPVDLFQRHEGEIKEHARCGGQETVKQIWSQ